MVKWSVYQVNIPTLCGQALWEEVQAGEEMAEEVLSLIFHPCLTSIEVTCLDRDDWAAHMVGSLNAGLILRVRQTCYFSIWLNIVLSVQRCMDGLYLFCPSLFISRRRNIIWNDQWETFSLLRAEDFHQLELMEVTNLQEIRKTADSGTHMMTRRFHLQGYEYKGPHTGQVFQLLMSGQANIFPPLVWQKLTDLSLLHFDWTSIHLPDLSQVRSSPNLTSIKTFHC